MLDGCEAGLLSGLLVEGERAGTFGLSHDLVRQTLSGGLSEARRVRLHAKVAAALQARTTTSPEQVVETARQLTLAAPAVGAAAELPYLVSVSEDALSRYAHESAEATLREALVVAGSITDPARRRAAASSFHSSSSSRAATARAARSRRASWSGKVSRKAPDTRTVTSARGPSRSGAGTIEKPVTRVEALSQVGLDLPNQYGVNHVYGFKWTANSLVWHVDGVVTQHYAVDAAAGAGDAFWLNLSLQVGGDWPGAPDGSTPFPSTMSVDYVRVYQPG